MRRPFMIYRRRCTARWKIYWSIDVSKKAFKTIKFSLGIICYKCQQYCKLAKIIYTIAMNTMVTIQ